MKQGIRTNKKDNSIVLHIVENRFGQNVRTGALVGRCIDGNILIGWSRVNVAAKDKFDADKAWLYASHNLLMGNPVPDTMQYAYVKFVERCCRYFEGGKLATVSYKPLGAAYKAKVVRKALKILQQENEEAQLREDVTDAVTQLINNKFPALAKNLDKGEIHLVL